MTNALKTFLEGKGRLAKAIVKPPTLKELLTRAVAPKVEDKVSPEEQATKEEKRNKLRVKLKPKAKVKAKTKTAEEIFFGVEDVEDVDLDDIDSDEMTIKISIKDGKVKLID